MCMVCSDLLPPPGTQSLASVVPAAEMWSGRLFFKALLLNPASQHLDHTDALQSFDHQAMEPALLDSNRICIVQH
jgi:hypothetical protein